MSTAPTLPSLASTCCIVGGGPAGVTLGLLLARAGVDVTIVEKHPDFNRDFRGDTVHPATLEIMHELGLLEELLKLPHQKVHQVGALVGGTHFQIGDFTRLPVHAPFIALMPQWDLLNFLAAEVRKHPNARILMQHKVTRLLGENGTITGAYAESPAGPVELHAALTVGCDGRHSVSTESAFLEHAEKGAPIDVLWFRVSRRPSDPEEGLGFLNCGRMLVLINRGDYFQCGYIIRKGSFERQIKPAGLDQLRRNLADLVPVLGKPGPDGKIRVDELTSWDQLKLLSVQVNCLRRWHRPGLLSIGDSAHAMSPVGGIGINLAIQDAVAAANILAAPLLGLAPGQRLPESTLASVQRRRSLPTRITQGFQILAHHFLNGFLGREEQLRAPLLLRLANRFAFLRRLAGRFIGMGVLPEHVRSHPLRTLRQPAPTANLLPAP